MDIHDTLIAKGAHWEDDERYSNTLRLPSDFIFVVANLELLNPSFSGVTTGISSPTSLNRRGRTDTCGYLSKEWTLG